MKQPETEETTLKPQVMPSEKTVSANEECWHPSRAGSPASWRPAEPREQPIVGPVLDHGGSQTPEAGQPSLETLSLPLNDPEVLLRRLKASRKYGKDSYQAVWEKYGLGASDQHAEKMEILETLFNNDNLPVNMYPVMLQAYPSLFDCQPGRDRFLHYADVTFSNLWNDIPD